jgi:hypothetical protein
MYRLIYNGLYVIGERSFGTSTPKRFAWALSVVSTTTYLITGLTLLNFFLPDLKVLLPIPSKYFVGILIVAFVFGSDIKNRHSFFGIVPEQLKDGEIAKAKRLAVLYFWASPVVLIATLLALYA